MHPLLPESLSTGVMITSVLPLHLDSEESEKEREYVL